MKKSGFKFCLTLLFPLAVLTAGCDSDSDEACTPIPAVESHVPAKAFVCATPTQYTLHLALVGQPITFDRAALELTLRSHLTAWMREHDLEIAPSQVEVFVRIPTQDLTTYSWLVQVKQPKDKSFAFAFAATDILSPTLPEAFALGGGEYPAYYGHVLGEAYAQAKTEAAPLALRELFRRYGATSASTDGNWIWKISVPFFSEQDFVEKAGSDPEASKLLELVHLNSIIEPESWRGLAWSFPLIAPAPAPSPSHSFTSENPS